jgi:hypothetical protein
VRITDVETELRKISTATESAAPNASTVCLLAADIVRGSAKGREALRKLRTLAKTVCDAAEECDSDDGRAYMVPGDDLDALADYLDDTEEGGQG